MASTSSEVNPPPSAVFATTPSKKRGEPRARPGGAGGGPGGDDSHLRLRRIGFVQDQGAEPDLAGKLAEIERGGTRLARPGDLRQPIASEIHELGNGKISHHRQHGPPRAEPGGVEGETVLAAERLHLAPVPVDGMAVRMGGTVPEAHGGAA